MSPIFKIPDNFRDNFSDSEIQGTFSREILLFGWSINSIFSCIDSTYCRERMLMRMFDPTPVYAWTLCFSKMAFLIIKHTSCDLFSPFSAM